MVGLDGEVLGQLRYLKGMDLKLFPTQLGGIVHFGVFGEMPVCLRAKRDEDMITHLSLFRDRHLGVGSGTNRDAIRIAKLGTMAWHGKQHKDDHGCGCSGPDAIAMNSLHRQG